MPDCGGVGQVVSPSGLPHAPARKANLAPDRGRSASAIPADGPCRRPFRPRVPTSVIRTVHLTMPPRDRAHPSGVADVPVRRAGSGGLLRSFPPSRRRLPRAGGLLSDRSQGADIDKPFTRQSSRPPAPVTWFPSTPFSAALRASLRHELRLRNRTSVHPAIRRYGHCHSPAARAGDRSSPIARCSP